MDLKKIIFPQKCVACQSLTQGSGKIFCRSCQRKITAVKPPVCLRCGKPIGSAEREYCADCDKRTWQIITENKAAYIYDGPIKDSLYAFKYSSQKWIGKAYAKEMYHHYRSWMEYMDFDAVIPVPVSRERLKVRGYNQAGVLAEEIVRCYNKEHTKSGLKVVGAVIRMKNTLPQKKLNADIRRKNLKKAFKLDKSVVELNGMSKLLIVDDIYTTGATLDAVGELLCKGDEVHKVSSMTIAIGRDTY